MYYSSIISPYKKHYDHITCRGNIPNFQRKDENNYEPRNLQRISLYSPDTKNSKCSTIK